MSPSLAWFTAFPMQKYYNLQTQATSDQRYCEVARSQLAARLDLLNPGDLSLHCKGVNSNIEGYRSCERAPSAVDIDKHLDSRKLTTYCK